MTKKWFKVFTVALVAIMVLAIVPGRLPQTEDNTPAPKIGFTFLCPTRQIDVATSEVPPTDGFGSRRFPMRFTLTAEVPAKDGKFDFRRKVTITRTMEF
jgi:hypothetical protein